MTADRPDRPGARIPVPPDRLPARIDKPWGYEIWYAWTDRYAGKILHVRRGGRLSLQYHREKDESSYVLRGRLLLTWGLSEDRLEVTEIGEGYAWRNRPGEIHTIEALEDADVLEVSTPELDDVVRLRDSYGREGTRQP
jgi:mannose-6-phosphate isomerase